MRTFLVPLFLFLLIFSLPTQAISRAQVCVAGGSIANASGVFLIYSALEKLKRKNVKLTREKFMPILKDIILLDPETWSSYKIEASYLTLGALSLAGGASLFIAAFLCSKK